MRRSSIAAEIGWLALYLSIFALLAALVIGYAVPHHFNDRIGVMLAAIVAGLAMIAIRGAQAKRR